MRTTTIAISETDNQILTIQYPNSVAFMYSRQSVIIEAQQDSDNLEKVTLEVHHLDSGQSHSESRAFYAKRAVFDISRAMQLLAPEVDTLFQRRMSHTAGQSLSEAYEIIVRVHLTDGTVLEAANWSIVGMYGTLDQGEIYGKHSQRRLWVNFPQTFNLWRDAHGETAFVMDDAYIYPDILDTYACHECDLIGTMLAAGELDEFKQMLPGRPQHNIGLTWNKRIERGQETDEELRIVTLVPDHSKRDDGTYLRWLNRRGEVSYYLFKNSQLRVTTSVSDSFSRYYEGDPCTPVGGVLQNELKAQYREAREMVIGASGVSLDEFEDLCDLASSPLVERLLPRTPEIDTEVGLVYDGGSAGSSSKVLVDSEAGEDYEVDAGDAAAPDRLKADEYVWQRVNVVAGSYARNIRRRTPNGQDFEILIELPERNTIKL